MRSSPRRLSTLVPFLAVLAAAACWSTLGIAYRLILDDVDIRPITLVTIRATFASLFVNALLLVSVARRRESLGPVRAVVTPILTLGLVSVALFYVLLVYAFEEAGVAVATVLLYLAPPMVAVGGWAAFRVPVTRPQALVLIVVFCGVAAVALGGGDTRESTLLGVALGVLSALTYATYSLVGRVALARAPFLIVVGWSLAIGTVVLWPVKLVVDGPGLPKWSEIATISLVSGLGATVLPLMLYTWGLSRIGPARASLFASVEPGVAVVLAYLVLGERLEPLQAVGAVVVLGGLALSGLERAEQPD